MNRYDSKSIVILSENQNAVDDFLHEKGRQMLAPALVLMRLQAAESHRMSIGRLREDGIKDSVFDALVERELVQIETHEPSEEDDRLHAMYAYEDKLIESGWPKHLAKAVRDTEWTYLCGIQGREPFEFKWAEESSPGWVTLYPTENQNSLFPNDYGIYLGRGLEVRLDAILWVADQDS